MVSGGIMIDRSINDAGHPAVTFIVEDQRPVSVVGDFNGWDPYAHPMAVGDDGLRRARVVLPPGTDIRFRYLADGDAWYDDADADDYDEHGGILRATAENTADDAAVDTIPKPRTRTARSAKPKTGAAGRSGSPSA
jgi:1,4-alpha-glucan branching enzyme